MGRSSAWRPDSLTRASGEDPTTVVSPNSRNTMYGDGLSRRRARYTWNGSSEQSPSNAPDSTSWYTSPSRMASCTRTTPSSNAALDRLARGEP